MISKFVNPLEGNYAKWECDGQPIVVSAAGRIFALPIASGNRIVVVDLHSSAGADNAAVLACDGKEVARIKSPLKSEGAIAFEDVYFVDDEITLILAFPSRQVACVIDIDGRILRTYETR